MPQMAPMYWLNMMIMMITIVMIMSSLNYFYTTLHLNNSAKSNKNKINWKW